MKTENRPNYHKIFSDIIQYKHPQKKKICEHFFEKKKLLDLDVIKLNDIIFDIKDKETEVFDQKHRSYGQEDILQILTYQQKNKINNTQLAMQFKLSRNTVAKWKKNYNL